MSKPYSVKKFLKLMSKVQKWRSRKQETDRVIQEHERDYIRFYKEQEHAKEKLAGVEATLRNYAIESYAETENRKPAPGVDIREMKKVYINGEPLEAYPDPFLLSWCISHRLFIRYDGPALRRFLLAFPELGPENTEVRAEPTVALAKDFSRQVEDSG